MHLPELLPVCLMPDTDRESPIFSSPTASSETEDIALSLLPVARDTFTRTDVPWVPLPAKVQELRRQKAIEIAETLFLENAFEAIRSGSDPIASLPSAVSR